MRTIASWLLLGAMGAGVSPAVVADSRPNPQKVWKVTLVTVQGGRMTAAAGAPLDATLTFSRAVRLQRVILPKGTYLFRMVTPSSIRVMRVSSADAPRTDPRIDVTFATTTVNRTDDLSQPLFKFTQSRTNWPPRLIAIFPENSSVGYRLLDPVTRQQGSVPVATTGTR
jgi:hypothetical protein